ncbi:MAG: YceI family protein [Acidobacteria bacterium]|nr:YceI family protein [Acidobacteriota bacterium]MBV9623642.1 YceI family protein [Acidobacteriota bacterium]
MYKRSRIMPRSIIAFALAALAPGAYGQVHAIDTSNSKLVVHAFKAGLFSGFADNHEIEAPVAEGTIDESGLQVKFVIDSRGLKVLDPQLSPDRRRQVQERMLGPEVLDSERFPRIEFQSTKVEQAGPASMLVSGKLSLHGAVRPISIKVHNDNGRYQGTCSIKQQDFGITPIRIAGGTVKVKDELKIDFDIRTNTQPNAARN